MNINIHIKIFICLIVYVNCSLTLTYLLIILLCIQGPTSNGYTCYCEPFIHRFEQHLDRNKKEVVKHLQNTHGRLSNRITSLEKKTKDQISYLSNSMKETIAQVKLNEYNYLVLIGIL